MKLSTVITAAAVLAGAVSVAGATSAATVFENYNYSYLSADFDQAALYVTNDSSTAYSDVTINGVDLGALAAGASTSPLYIGDPCETISCNATITINGFSTSVYTPDYDFAVTGANIGEIGTGGVPEPATWALMLVGFGALGAALRGRKSVVA